MDATILRFGVALCGIIAAGVFSITSNASAQQFTMKMSSPTINDVTHEYFKRIKAGVEQRSNGRIKVEIYPANQLGQIPAVVEGVALGTIELGVAASGFFVSLEPRFQVLDAPGLFDNIEHAYKVMTDPEIRKRWATWGNDKGVEMFSPGIYSPLSILSHKATRAAADFQGQKVRTPGGAAIQVEPYRKLGIIPVSLPLGEALPAMQNRTIDGLISGLAVYTNFKYYDIAKAVTNLPATTLIAPAIVNRQFMKSLGPDLEKIVREEALKAEAVYADWNVQDNKRGEDLWKKNGGEMINMAPAEAKRYLDVVAPAANSILSANVKVKEDYDAFLAVGKKYR
jgi:TRAP-type C4-dicarboxylate transport system substrate-binding protein